MLPGIAGSVNDSAELSVRGSTPDQTRIAVDGFTLYQFGGGSGVYSGYNLDTVERGDLSSISADANDGGRLASTLRLNGRTGSNRPWSDTRTSARWASTPASTRVSAIACHCS